MPLMPSISRAELLKAMQGRSARLDRREAFSLLVASDEPDREALLAAVADDPGESLSERAAAALSLGHVPTPKAVELLARTARSAPPAVLPDVLRSLGRIGGPEALEVVDAHAGSDVWAVADAARFAGALIAHRFGLAGHDLPVPSAGELLAEAGDESRPMTVASPTAEDAQSVLASLARESYGLDLVATTQICCGTDVNTVCLNRQFAAAGSARELLERKAVLALVGLASREDGGHSVSYIVLSAPSRSGETIDLLAPRCTGRPALAGTARVEDNTVRFSLRSFDRPGARAFVVDGTLQEGHVTITTAAVASTRRPAPRPARRVPA